jgi:hypothetical protein
MTERPKPYVGISGVVNPVQQIELRGFAGDLQRSGRQLALGVKAVHKTQWLDIENKYGRDWYPVGDEIGVTVNGDSDDELRVAQIFLDRIDAINRGEKEYERRFVDKLLGRAGHTLNAFQFDLLPWDSRAYTNLFLHIKQARPDIKILLQAHKQQMAQHGPYELVRRLNWYDGLVDYVLFDASHGTGARLDVEALTPFVETAYRQTSVGVGVAGGLNATIVEQDLPQLLRSYPTLSFDAEGQLHRNDDSGSNTLNMAATKDYLAAAITAINAAHQR